MPQDAGFYGSSSEEEVTPLDENMGRRGSESAHLIATPTGEPARARSPSIHSISSSSSRVSAREREASWDHVQPGEETQTPITQNAGDHEQDIFYDDADPTVQQNPNGRGDTQRPAVDQLSLSSNATSSSRHNRNDSWVGVITQSSSSDSDHRHTPTNFDTHFYSTNILLSGITLPIKIPTSSFPGEVGDVSKLQYININYNDRKQRLLLELLVLSDSANSNIFVPNLLGHWSPPSPSPYQRYTHTSDNRALQCPHHPETCHLPWLRKACRTCRQFCARGVCVGFRMWLCTSRLHTTGFSVYQSHQSPCPRISVSHNPHQ